ncbi:transcription factor WRKY19-like [Hordeum vulgare subsp. vulgare]|uniref:transcription factor WRKY19-like n=1 Tax=Hordeum vulgare subsp. vulgare TaxID=112509 RepID=UPI001D1A3469|nr:transcription factor WRKY19-like [Hordeum vulgare subsp. vulgare]
MKHIKKSSSSSRLFCDDDRSAAALREMAREQSLVTQLRAVVLPAIQLAGGERAEVVAQMFESILDCSAKAIAALKLLRLDHSQVDDEVLLTAMVDDKTRVRKIVPGDGGKDGDDNAKPLRRQRKRRRLGDDSVALETPVPHYDGHQWRKYGQKIINHTKHPRSYYKCTYKQEQDCKATKTVQQQQQQQDGGIEDEPVMYAVVYYGQHTCKPGQTDAAVVQTASSGRFGEGGGEELARSNSCSNISVTCSSVVVDNHQLMTASLESCCNLLDMAGDMATAEVNQYDQLFDVASFSPFDSGTAWAMDVSEHGLQKFGGW